MGVSGWCGWATSDEVVQWGGICGRQVVRQMCRVTPRSNAPRLSYSQCAGLVVGVGVALSRHTARCCAQVPAYVVQRLQRIREAGSNQAERKRRARLLALLAALIRVRVSSWCVCLVDACVHVGKWAAV